MIKLFKTYFQKSKLFLYPLLGLSKGLRYIPQETYIMWKDYYSIDHMKLCCVYKQKPTKSYLLFEEKKIFKHQLFYDYKQLDDDLHLYVFDFSVYPQTWVAFVNGLYSKINEREKKTIINFFENSGDVVSETLESYLHPEFYHEDYSELLAVSEELIERVYEVCDKPDLNKETLKIKIKKKYNVLKKSLSLSKIK